MKIFLIGFCSTIINFLLIFTSNAQTIVFGQASSYKNDTLELIQVQDFITFKKNVIVKTIVDKNGFFKFEFNISRTQEILINLFAIEASLIVSPNDTIEIRIPKKVANSNNTSFEKKIVPAIVVSEDTNGLNYKTNYINFIIYSKRDILLLVANENLKQKILDTAIFEINSISNTSNCDYFENYKKFAIAYLQTIVFKGITKKIIFDYFSNSTFLDNIPIFVTEFNLVFDNFFSPFNDLIEYSKIFVSIKDNNFTNIVNYLETSSFNFSKEMSYFVALKGLFDMYYAPISSILKEDIVSCLQKELDNNTDSLKTIYIKNILESFIKLKKGYCLDDFELMDKNKNIIKLSDFKDNFVYLNFVNIENKAGFQYFEMMKRYTDQKVKLLKIVTIFVGSDFNVFKNYVEKNKNYNWTFLFADKKSIVINQFDINQYPTFFLIDPNGCLAIDYCPSPNENFEQIYNSAFINWQNQKQNQNKNQLNEHN